MLNSNPGNNVAVPPTDLFCVNAFSIVWPKRTGIFAPTVDVPPSSISIFTTSFITSLWLHVNITVHVSNSLFPVMTHHVVSIGVVEEDHPPHDDFLVHWATKSAHHSGICDGNSGSHQSNLYHPLVGSSGAVKSDSYFHVIDSTSLPQLLSNVIAYLFLL